MQKKIESYISFARKYRPKNFNELLGQEVLTKTLTHSILNNKLSQAILLTGIRGVGKTSSARIIAKTINCSDANKQNDHVIPCDHCDNCISCNKANHPDIIEIDAASYTSVEDVRQIIKGSEYKPLLGKHKLFIIDEVHMISKNAFNALLKILEEPPEHVIFIFATTEVRKIPVTVLSRCQRYDLRRFTVDETTQLIQNISNFENIKITNEAIKLIAIKSEGSARDAVSLLEQAVNYNNGENSSIEISLINKMIGATDIHITLKLIKLIVASNAKDALALLNKIYIDTHNPEYFLISVIELIAELTKAKVISNYANPMIANITDEVKEILIGISLSRLSILWQIFSGGLVTVKNSHNQLVAIEMLILKAIYACNLPQMEEIIQCETRPQIQKDSNTGLASNSSSIFDFLKFCHSQKELDIYYFLLNEVAVDKYENNILEIFSKTDVKKEILDKIKKLLYKFNNTEWNIKTIQKEQITPLKNHMIEEVKQGKDYMKIKNKFPNAYISDILLSTH